MPNNSLETYDPVVTVTELLLGPGPIYLQPKIPATPAEATALVERLCKTFLIRAPAQLSHNDMDDHRRLGVGVKEDADGTPFLTLEPDGIYLNFRGEVTYDTACDAADWLHHTFEIWTPIRRRGIWRHFRPQDFMPGGLWG